ncbi:hypothetical protein D1BOALGB6SA_3371 [Olavius sp. associated proteobacterium Delta 1]|nr:hypothetical protein D1BOALGB6SA_3371 [Olavius sp. associated proteobacterium Delta 1]
MNLLRITEWIEADAEATLPGCSDFRAEKLSRDNSLTGQKREMGSNLRLTFHGVALNC